MNAKPDMLLFFSDQHSGTCTGYSGNPEIRTPNLDRLARQGTVFNAAYTPCPLCVPARSACLTGQLPSHTGIYTNSGVIPSDQTTFLHSLAVAGYETVLCGRMHFKGPDQRHGFTRRIAPELTATMHGTEGRWQEGFGPYARTLGMNGCLDVIGGGPSLVLEYDRSVVEAALDYLQQKHDKPQCIVIGTYGPHFPYVAPLEHYRYYLETLEKPPDAGREVNYAHPIFDAKRQTERLSARSGCKEPVTDEIRLRARAAYSGMITRLDEQVGRVRSAWQTYLERNRRPGVFVYFSDHGDTCGEHGIFGKQSFYEGSARVPLLIAGAGVRPDTTVSTPATLLDIGPTLCDLAGTSPPPRQDGASLAPALVDGRSDPGRHVFSEWVQRTPERPVPGRMIRQGEWKMIAFDGLEDHDLLFDLDADPSESTNLASSRPEKASELKATLVHNWDVRGIAERYREQSEHQEMLRKWGETVSPPEPERRPVPRDVLALPEIN